MNIEHFTMFACGFLSAWSCFQIQSQALRRITRRKPRYDRRGSNPPSPNAKPQPPSGPPNPQFPPGRVTDVHGTTIGYRSIPSGLDTNSPPREP